MDVDQKRQVIEHLAKVANERLRKLEKTNLTQYAYQRARRLVSTDKELVEKPRFLTNVKDLSDTDVNKQLLKLEDFLQRPSSTVSGARKALERAVQTLKKDRITESGDYARGLELITANRNDFFDFLTSLEYKQMERLVASEDLQEFFLDVKGAIPDQALYTLFDDFIAGSIGWNEIYDEIYHLQELELKEREGELTEEENREFERFFK